MNDPEQSIIPEKLPLLWRLTFGFFVASGLVSFLGVIGEQSPSAAIGGVISAGVLLGAGVLGLKRHRAAIYLSMLILVGSAIHLDLPLLFQDDYVANEIRSAYAEINAIAATTLTPDPELISKIETLYHGFAVAITVLHLWMSLYLWRRRHWLPRGVKPRLDPPRY